MVKKLQSPENSFTTAPKDSPSEDISQQSLVAAIVTAADDRKAADITVLKVSDVSYLCDYFVIATGFSPIQVRAIAEAIEKNVREKFDKPPIRNEGKREANWVLLDYGDVIVHLFLPEEREFYNLEAFWGHAERLELPQLRASGELG